MICNRNLNNYAFFVAAVFPVLFQSSLIPSVYLLRESKYVKCYRGSKWWINCTDSKLLHRATKTTITNQRNIFSERYHSDSRSKKLSESVFKSLKILLL